MNAFELLPGFLQNALKRLDITEPTPVQEGAGQVIQLTLLQ